MAVIDSYTADKFAAAQQSASKHGLSLMEVLHNQGLLLTQKRKRDLETGVLDNLLRRLDRQTVNKIMSFYYGRTDGTPAEMFAAVKYWLEAVIRNLANNTLEDL